MTKINLNESLFEAVNSLGVERPDTYKKRQKPLSILAFDSLEKLGYNVFASRKGNGYEISKRNEKNLQKAKDLCDTLNLNYVVKPFRDRYYMTINLPKEDDAVINSYFRSTDRAMAEKVTTKKGSNKLNKYLKEDENISLTVEDKLEFLKDHETYNGQYSRPCKVWDLDLTPEQEKEFYAFLADGELEDFWKYNEDISTGIYQDGRQGGHLVLDPEILNPSDFEGSSFSELVDSYLSNYEYPEGKDEFGYDDWSDEQLDRGKKDVTDLINNSFNILTYFDDNVDKLIDNLKDLLDRRINNLEESKTSINKFTKKPIKESIQEVKNILQPLVTKDGKVRALRDDEKLPRRFRFKSGTSTSGEVTYKGTDYAYAVVNGKLKVMTSAEAGDNWSETIYKESIENVYQRFIETIEEYADEHDLDLDNLTERNDIIPEAGDYYRAAVEDLISLGKEWEGYFGKISHTVLDDIKEMVKEKLGIGEILKKLKDDATKYLTESFANDSLKYDRDAAKKFKNDFDVASPQETANVFGKNVSDNGKIYKPTIKEEFNQSEIDFIFSSKDEKYPYMILSRLKSDCDYYLGAGNKADKHLWALNPKDQIAYMRAIYNRLDPKPEWLTSEQIDEYEKNMLEEHLQYDSTVKNESFEDEHLGTKVEKSLANHYAIEINGEIYCDDLGEPYHFNTAKEAQEFIEEQELKDAKVVAQYGLSEDLVPEPPKEGTDTGIASMLNSLIIDEFEAIDGYNSAIATAEQEGMTDIVNVLKDIVNEENLHVGQLQTCLAKVSPNAQSIDDGQVEAQQQLDNINQTQATQEVTEAFDVEKVKKRIARVGEFDNGRVLFKYEPMNSAEAEERAKQMSLKYPEDTYYVAYDDIMEPMSDIKWKNGQQVKGE